MIVLWWQSYFTVNSEIFARVLFLRNFVYAKFRENKTSRNVSLSSTDLVYLCPSREFETWQICFSTRFAKIKFSRNFPVPTCDVEACIMIFKTASLMWEKCQKHKCCLENCNSQPSVHHSYISVYC